MSKINWTEKYFHKYIEHIFSRIENQIKFSFSNSESHIAKSGKLLDA